MHTIKRVVIHCADTPPGMDIGASEIRKWHVDGNGWADIGYHYVIRRDGTVETGRDLDGDGDIEEEIGAHVYGHNRGTLGVCLVGGAEGECDFTSAQWNALDDLVTNIIGRHGLSPSAVLGHRDLDDGKTCPNFNAPAWASSL